MKLVTAEEMRRIDAAAIEKYGVPSVVLMENAGRHVAQALQGLLNGRPGARVLVICGKGNNGGDGFVAARHLVSQGVEVQVALLTHSSELMGNAATNFRIAHAMGVPIIENPDAEAVKVRAGMADIIVDAVLGTGLTGEVRSIARSAIEAMNDSTASVVAVDIPSGVHADTGAALGVAVEADLTVTFAAAKIGLVQFPGAQLCGELRVVDITIPRGLTASDAIKANLVSDGLAQAMLPPREEAMHKGHAGRVLVVAGSVGMTGAAALCAQAATRAGAGLVHIACPASLNDVLEAKCTEAMTVPLPQTDARTIAPEARPRVVELGAHSDAVALGPGLSADAGTAEFVRATVADIAAPIVIDADGLNCLGNGLALLSGRRDPTIITPHPGELARLMDTTVEAIQADRVDAARRAASAANAVVVLKGAGTVIAQPSAEVWINLTGNSGMASGGMGDVLTGVIAAFLAGGARPVEAAVAGAYYHGLAADTAAEDGMRGLAAADVAWALQEVLPD